MEQVYMSNNRWAVCPPSRRRCTPGSTLLEFEVSLLLLAVGVLGLSAVMTVQDRQLCLLEDRSPVRVRFATTAHRVVVSDSVSLVRHVASAVRLEVTTLSAGPADNLSATVIRWPLQEPLP